MPRKILITGVNGQLGSALYKKLSENFIVLPTARLHLKNEAYIESMDITNREEISTLLKSFVPDIIINCAAYTDVDGSDANKNIAHKINVEGLRNIIQLSSSFTHIIQISSDYIYDGLNGPYIETDHTFPLNYYGKTKLEAENILRGSNKSWSILRPNVLYGENINCKGNFFAWIYNNLKKNKSIKVVSDQISNPTYIGEMVQIIFQSIIMNFKGVLNVGSDDYLSRYSFALQIANIFDFNSSLITEVNTPYLYENIKSYIAERPLNSSLVVHKMKDELNFSPKSTNYNLKQIKTKLLI